MLALAEARTLGCTPDTHAPDSAAAAPAVARATALPGPGPGAQDTARPGPASARCKQTSGSRTRTAGAVAVAAGVSAFPRSRDTRDRDMKFGSGSGSDFEPAEEERRCWVGTAAASLWDCCRSRRMRVPRAGQSSECGCFAVGLRIAAVAGATRIVVGAGLVDCVALACGCVRLVVAEARHRWGESERERVCQSWHLVVGSRSWRRRALLMAAGCSIVGSLVVGLGPAVDMMAAVVEAVGGSLAEARRRCSIVVMADVLRRRRAAVTLMLQARPRSLAGL